MEEKCDEIKTVVLSKINELVQRLGNLKILNMF